MAEITTGHLTEASLTGAGVFDELMKATKAHLHEEYSKGRIKGPDYASVYLGSMTAVMQQAVTFLVERDRAAAQAALLREQVNTEIKQQLLLDKQIEKTVRESDLLLEQKAKLQAETALLNQQILKVGAEINILVEQLENTIAERNQTLAQTELIQQQKLNAVTENTKLEKEICKLEAEFDVLMETKLKTVSETALLTQKKATESAQIASTGVALDSVIGRQKSLYAAQAEGLARDAEQKAAKVLVDSWAVRRTTDEGTMANTQNKLDDGTVGRAVNKLITGVGA